MKIIGITGSSGSGKTTLSKILNEREDVKVIDADEVVKEMSIPGTKYLEAIKETFGQEVFLEDGRLNRKRLAQKIYNDNESREKLNKLTFNYVVKEIITRTKSITDKNIKFAIIDAPLLFESKLDNCCDYVIALIADFDLKVRRICKRDKIDEETAKSRLNIQNEDSYYTEKANFVIKNSENCDLKSEIEKIFKEILKG
ncbi:MAG: dephospho-CoA kinase [Clostridia bacterium]|nr:dephospho-CoA kinase [Clostridia bacterium]